MENKKDENLINPTCGLCAAAGYSIGTFGSGIQCNINGIINNHNGLCGSFVLSGKYKNVKIKNANERLLELGFQSNSLTNGNEEIIMTQYGPSFKCPGKAVVKDAPEVQKEGRVVFRFFRWLLVEIK